MCRVLTSSQWPKWLCEPPRIRKIVTQGLDEFTSTTPSNDLIVVPTQGGLIIRTAYDRPDQLVLYNTLGQPIAAFLTSGAGQFFWRLPALPSGIYWIKAQHLPSAIPVWIQHF